MLENVNAALPLILDLVRYLAYAIGILLVGLSLYGFANFEQDHRESKSKSIVLLAIGGILLGFDTWSTMIITTVTDDSMSTYTSPTLSYTNAAIAETNDPYKSLLMTILGVVQFFGYLAIFKGILMFKKVSEGGHSQGDPVMSAVNNIAFGAAAVNIKWTLTMLTSLMGMTVPSFL